MSCEDLDLSELNEAISERENRITLALDVAMVGIWDWDLRTGKLTWDSRMHRLFGTNPLTFGGDYASFAACVNPEDMPEINRRVQDTIDHDAPYNYAFRLLTSPRRIRGQGRLFRDKNGKPEASARRLHRRLREREALPLQLPLHHRAPGSRPALRAARSFAFALTAILIAIRYDHG